MFVGLSKVERPCRCSVSPSIPTGLPDNGLNFMFRSISGFCGTPCELPLLCEKALVGRLGCCNAARGALSSEESLSELESEVSLSPLAWRRAAANSEMVQKKIDRTLINASIKGIFKFTHHVCWLQKPCSHAVRPHSGSVH